MEPRSGSVLRILLYGIAGIVGLLLIGVFAGFMSQYGGAGDCEEVVPDLDVDHMALEEAMFTGAHGSELSIVLRTDSEIVLRELTVSPETGGGYSFSGDERIPADTSDTIRVEGQELERGTCLTAEIEVIYEDVETGLEETARSVEPLVREW